MDFMSGSGLTTLAGVDVVAGFVLLGRGLVGYRSSAQVSGIGTSSISSLAAGEVRSLFAVVERYPDIKSQASVQDLQHEIERLESMIADRRELYSDQVYRYNTRIAQLPGALPASHFAWQPREFFAVDPADAVPSDTDLGLTGR